MANTDPIQLGWGNQPRVLLHPGGELLAPGVDLSPPGSIDSLIAGGDGLYRAASIVNDQVRSPFDEARASYSRLAACLSWVDGLFHAVRPGVTLLEGLTDTQARQLRASAGVVTLSIAEAQLKRKSKESKSLVRRIIENYITRLDTETDPLLAERLAINLDWIIGSLPGDLATKSREALRRHLQWSPPYEGWFTGGNLLRIDWKCGPEFIEGWRKRLLKEGFTAAGERGVDAVFKKVYETGKVRTEVELLLSGENRNVFSRMNDPSIHIVGYDGHSDWGRKIPRSLYNSTDQVGEKAVFYLLCSGKQILQKVRDRYPKAHIVTTFNSARFTADMSYSEDFSAFMNILAGLARRESWEQIRNRVNSDWYNNPEKNYIFPGEALIMDRSLDRDHDGQADIFDRLIDYNTFDVGTDALEELSPRVPETPPERIVGTKLHMGVQVFHTLAHFNQLLDRFTRELRVFADGWFDPTTPVPAGVIERGPTRVRVEMRDKAPHYHFQGSSHYAHATEEAWRALASLALCIPVMAHEPELRNMPPEDRVLTGLLLVAHGLEVDDAPGRDSAVWRRLLPVMALPGELELSDFQAAKRVDSHWYAGARASLPKLKELLKPETLAAVKAYAVSGTGSAK